MDVQDLLTTTETAPACLTSNAMPRDSCCRTSSESDVKRGWVAPFLLHLHQMLRREDANILRWSDDGMAFHILDKDTMAAHVLPKYFKNKNFSSFQRQLNYFGFRKWSKARAPFPTYSREYFTRDNYSAMSLVKRQSKKSRKRKTFSEKEQRPAKLAATEPPSSLAGDKCKPILPRLGTSPRDTRKATQYHSHLVSPPMKSTLVFSLPVLSPTRKVKNGCKLPSIQELSQFAIFGHIHPRLMT
ncbi:hypothetical protein PsorP6_003070 [Peronosclerospora sorghi]|uniref:Uncharacterized protein n=1 Tax=Peronosclerospora sorghi TaxID=230839 RepID=A0ACC0VN29_9STRA|nr:hypothetical protein PsorP6_003070 [Peronosclerospora sorghi]